MSTDATFLLFTRRNNLLSLMLSCIIELEATIVFSLQTVNEKRFRKANNHFIVS